jgi:hypothetical protein
MKQNAAAVASLFPQGRVNPCDVATQLVATLPRAQLAKSYAPLLQQLAGPLYPRISRIFGGPHAPIYILTEPYRRQVWNAVIAARYPEGDLDRLRTDLLEWKSHTLLEQAYGSVPRGFTTVLGKCEDIGLDADFYRFWHGYLTEYPEDFPAVAARPAIGLAITKLLREAPRELARVPILCKVGDITEISRLIEAMTWIHGGRPDPSLWGALAGRLLAGEKPLTILTKIADAVTYPAPYIKGDPRFRHLGTVLEMKAIGHEYENCLGSAFSLKDAVQGAEQYYEYCDGDDRLIVSITADMPFGYVVDDIRGHKNQRPALELRARVEGGLAEHGITRRKSVFDIIEDWGGVEDEFERIEEFFQFDP